MRTLQIEILHPKAAKLLKDLEEMDLISNKNQRKKVSHLYLKNLEVKKAPRHL